MPVPLVRIEGLHFAYPAVRAGISGAPALRDIHLTVEVGECVAIMGASGAGKTTLCLALNGLVPQSTGGTFRGNVWVNGHNTRTEPVAALATQVGLVFQEAENQLCTMSVEDEVAFGLENLGLPVDEIERRITWALEVVAMNHLRRHSPAQLSGGQQQRLALASVLAMHPALLVLDEPTGGLDPIGRRGVLEVIAALQRQGTTIMMATQDAEAVAALANRVVVLHEGAIALEGTPREVFGQVARLRELGVALPQLSELSDLLGSSTPWLTVSEAAQALQAGFAPTHRVGATGRSPVGAHDDSPVARPGGEGNLTAPNPDAGMVRFEDVWYRYANGVQALRAIDLRIDAGDYIALIGANGSGKSTLARHISGLLRPQTGRVTVLGQDTRHIPPGALARHVGYVFQNPDHQIFAPTVWEEVAFGPRNLGWDAATVRQRVAEALERFQLAHLAEVPPATLSLGGRRLVTLASVHAMQPQVLVLDEPTSGLDRRLSECLIAWVRECHQAGHAVVFITHDMQRAALASRCVVLQDGGIMMDAPVAEAFAQADALARAGLMPPPIVELSLRLGLQPPPLTVADFCHRIKQDGVMHRRDRRERREL
ncbi:MAG: ABC transporter ATP-binding protein [Anaerolineae bacterium]